MVGARHCCRPLNFTKKNFRQKKKKRVFHLIVSYSNIPQRLKLTEYNRKSRKFYLVGCSHIQPSLISLEALLLLLLLLVFTLVSGGKLCDRRNHPQIPENSFYIHSYAFKQKKTQEFDQDTGSSGFSWWKSDLKVNSPIHYSTALI